MNYLAQGLSQGFDQGVAAYNNKKKRQEDKAQRELENEMRQRQLDFEISHAQRQFNRQVGRDDFDMRNADRGFAFQVTSKQGDDAFRDTRATKDDEYRTGRATSEDNQRSFEREIAQKKLDAAIEQFGTKHAFDQKVYAETQGPGSPGYAYPLMMGQAAMERAKKPAFFDETKPTNDTVTSDDGNPEGTVVEQNGIRYRKTNGAWIPVK